MNSGNFKLFRKDLNQKQSSMSVSSAITIPQSSSDLVRQHSLHVSELKSSLETSSEEG